MKTTLWILGIVVSIFTIIPRIIKWTYEVIKSIIDENNRFD